MAGAIVAVVVVVIGAVVGAGWLLAARSRRLAAAEVVEKLTEPARQRAQLHGASALVGIADMAAERLLALGADLDRGMSPAPLAPPRSIVADQLQPVLVTTTRLDDVATQLTSAQLLLTRQAAAGSPLPDDALEPALRAAGLPESVVEAAAVVRTSQRDGADVQPAADADDVLTRYLAEGAPVAAADHEHRPRTRRSDSAKTAAGDVVGQQRGPAGRSLGYQARALIVPADPHGLEKRDLLAVMTRLGLDTDSPGLREWPGYSALLSGYEDTLRDRARELAQQVTATMQREPSAGTPHEQTQAATPPLDGPAGADIGQCVGELADAAERYRAAVSSLLASARLSAPETGGGPGAAAARQALEAVPAALAESRQQLADGNSRDALAALTATLLPVSKSWPPSQEYATACASAARRLTDTAAGRCATAAQTCASHLEDVRVRHDRISAAISGSLTVWATRRDELWTELRAAACRVQREAARILVSRAARRDVTVPVEAAAALLGIQELTSAGLSHAVRTAIPVPGAVLESHTADPQLHRVERSIDAFDRGAVVLAGIDGLLSPLLSATGPNSGAELAVAMRQFAPVPRDIHLALTELAAYLKHPEAGLSLTKTAASAISHVQDHVMPDLSVVANEGFVHFLGTAARAATELHGIADLFGPDGSLAQYGFERLGESVVGELIRHAQSSPLVDLSEMHVNYAADHLGHAAGHAAPALLHGVVAHVPYVTLVMSVTREVRIQREYKTSLDEAVKSIALDVGGVSAGILTGELLAHLLALHAAVVTIPATIVARLGTRQLRKRALTKAQGGYAAEAARYETRSAELASQLGSSLGSAVERERAAYQSRIGRPETLSLAAAAQLGSIVRGLRAVTADYAQRVGALLSAEQSLPGAGIRADARTAAMGALDGVTPALARCDQQLREGRVLEALMTVAGVRLPATDAWSAGRAYQETWTETVARLRAMEDQYWRRVATWATDACAQFSVSEQRLSEFATVAIDGYKTEVSALQVELDKAAKDVEVRSAHLHGRAKH